MEPLHNPHTIALPTGSFLPILLAAVVTQILYRGGRASLAVHLDEFAKMIWGWHLSASASVSLVLDSFHRAMQKIRSVGGELRGLVVHQDRGSVYTSDAYARTVKRGPSGSCNAWWIVRLCTTTRSGIIRVSDIGRRWRS